MLYNNINSMNFNLPIDSFIKQIHTLYNEFSWTKPTLVDKCNDNSTLSQQKFKENPTQSFIKHYFNPTNPNGLFLYHSVGAGKTISGLLLVQKFQSLGYDVIWVTRTTLKNDLQKGINLVPTLPFKVYSYKQFSNICSERGANYNLFVEKKGEKDIFNKTLIIIDEAHKLYIKDLKVQEQHNIKLIENKIFNSYKVSGVNSLKLVLMTATPITDDYMEFVKLINLLIQNPEKRFTINNNSFIQQFISTNNGEFTSEGLISFREKIKGIVSYIDLSNDPRNFAQVNYTDILVPLSIPYNNIPIKERKIQCSNNLKICNNLGFDKELCQYEKDKCEQEIKDISNQFYQLNELLNKCKYNPFEKKD